MEVVVRTILKRLALSGLVVSFAVLALRSRTVRETFARTLSVWRSLTAFGRVAVCLFLLVGVLVGGDKTNSVPPNMNAPLAQMQNGEGSFQTGFTGLTGLPGAGNLVNPVNPVKNNIPAQTASAQYLFAAWKAANWNVRGAWKDSFWFPFEDDWVFPRGTNHLSGVEVTAQGAVWATPFGDTVASIGFPVEIVRGLATFSCGHTPSNTYVFAWRDAAVGRDTDNLASAAIELFRNGDIATTTNGVVHLRKYVNPYDEDGDGIPDERDPNPGFCDGDFFCTAPALPDGSNQDAYYWLQICATGVMDCARISVVCDGESNLGNYSVIARTGQMASLPLLAGATYDVESDISFSWSEVSSEYAHIATNSETSLSVSLPLSFVFEQMRGRGSYRFCSYPIDVRPGPVSLSGGCCDIETNSFGFAWNCSGNCSCGGGGHLIDCTASWEGYSHFFGWWGNCPCMPEPEKSEEPHGDHGPYLRLDMPNTLFTNNDGGAEASDVVRLVAGGGGMSNGVMTLSCTLPECVKLWRNASRTEEETLPVSWNPEIEPEKTFYLEGAYAAARGSAAMILELSGDASCGMLSTNIPLAVYCPLVNVVNAALSDNGELCNPCAIPAGSNACFAVEFEGAHPPQEEIVWSIAEGNARFVGGNTGERVRVASDVPGEIVRLRVRIGDSRSRPPEIVACVAEPLTVKLTVWIVGDDKGSHYAADTGIVYAMVEQVNNIYRQAAVSFYVDAISYTNNGNLLDLRDGLSKVYSPAKRKELVDMSQNTGGLELYFIDSINGKCYANHDIYGIVLSSRATAITLAHEIGHAFGCPDIYPNRKVGNMFVQAQIRPYAALLPLDWNNGDGGRYYSLDTTCEGLICRLLMYGIHSGSRRDLSFGSIHGILRDGSIGLADVGFFRSGTRRSINFHR